VITDEFGGFVQAMRFEPFGKRVEVVDVTKLPRSLSEIESATLANTHTNHGFTGHEHLDAFGLIHMGGRLYDPHMGRFLNMDPVVQAPENGQNLNRYSYVLNNPLSYTDPTGFSFFKIFRSIAAIGVLFVPIPGLGVIAAGFISGFILSGNLKGALIGAFTAGAFEGLGSLKGIQGFFARGIVGGVAGVLSGGKFLRGFVSAGITQGVNKITSTFDKAINRVISSAVLGGTVSRLTGGKFGNGAFTAGFAQALAEKSSSFGQSNSRAARAANCESGGSCEGFERVSLSEFGIDSKPFVDTDSGFEFGLFRDDEGLILAFRGTGGNGVLSDWWTNVRQAFGFETKQFNLAVGLAKSLSRAIPTGTNFLLVGHSLGGGLASAAALATHRHAVTFNASGLSNGTIAQFGLNPSDARGLITAFHTAGDVLTLLQDATPLPDAIGTRVILAPTRLATPIGYHLQVPQ